MSDIKLFRMDGHDVVELTGEAAALEKSLQTLMERNLDVLLGVRFLASEYSTGTKHAGRIDSLGIDENGSPVIIEYKRSMNENVINQGLYYLDWLMDHQAQFQLLVTEKLGQEHADRIDWSAPRLLCIAGGFNKFDAHAVEQMNRNIELLRYRHFGDDLLLLELMNAATATPTVPTEDVGARGRSRTVSEVIERTEGPLRDLYEMLRAFILALGDDVQEKVLKYYIAFKRMKNFVCVEMHPTSGHLTLYLKVDPGGIEVEEGFTRDMRGIGHYGTGDLEVTLSAQEDLERAKDLIIRSYEAS